MNPLVIAIEPFTLYLVVNGSLYVYKGFKDVKQPKLFILEKYAEFICDNKGNVIKNRGTVNIKIITQTIQDLITGDNKLQMPVREVTNETLVHLTEERLIQERVQLFQIMELYKNA